MVRANSLPVGIPQKGLEHILFYKYRYIIMCYQFFLGRPGRLDWGCQILFWWARFDVRGPYLLLWMLQENFPSPLESFFSGSGSPGDGFAKEIHSSKSRCRNHQNKGFLHFQPFPICDMEGIQLHPLPHIGVTHEATM